MTAFAGENAFYRHGDLRVSTDAVKNQAEETPRKLVALRSADGDLLVAYLPDNREIVLDLKSMAPGLTGRWFNPVTGASVSVEPPVVPGSIATLRRPAGWMDAVLLLSKPDRAG